MDIFWKFFYGSPYSTDEDDNNDYIYFSFSNMAGGAKGAGHFGGHIWPGPGGLSPVLVCRLTRTLPQSEGIKGSV